MGTNDHLEPRKSSSRKNSSKQAMSPSSGWQGFVNVNLTDDAKKQWFRWAKDSVPFFEALNQMLLDGYKVTIKYEERNDCYSAFATGGSPDHRDSGWGLSERAGDGFTAVNRLVYIHAVVLSRDWEPYKGSGGYKDDWA